MSLQLYQVCRLIPIGNHSSNQNKYTVKCLIMVNSLDHPGFAGNPGGPHTHTSQSLKSFNTSRYCLVIISMLFPTPTNLKIAYYQHKPKTPPRDKHLQTHCAHYATDTTRNLGPTEVSKEKPGTVVCPSTEETVLEGPFAPRSSRPA